MRIVKTSLFGFFGIALIAGLTIASPASAYPPGTKPTVTLSKVNVLVNRPVTVSVANPAAGNLQIKVGAQTQTLSVVTAGATTSRAFTPLSAGIKRVVATDSSGDEARTTLYVSSIKVPNNAYVSRPAPKTKLRNASIKILIQWVKPGATIKVSVGKVDYVAKAAANGSGALITHRFTRVGTYPLTVKYPGVSFSKTVTAR
jgi:hypothetical protein